MSAEGQQGARTRRPRPGAVHGALQPAHVAPLADQVPDTEHHTRTKSAIDQDQIREKKMIC